MPYLGKSIPYCRNGGIVSCYVYNMFYSCYWIHCYQRFLLKYLANLEYFPLKNNIFIFSHLLTFLSPLECNCYDHICYGPHCRSILSTFTIYWKIKNIYRWNEKRSIVIHKTHGQLPWPPYARRMVTVNCSTGCRIDITNLEMKKGYNSVL